MKRIKRILVATLSACLLAQTSFGAGISFPSGQADNRSPDGRFDLMWVPPKDNEGHSLLFKSQADGKSEVLLTFARHLEALWSPDSNHLAITDYSGSNESDLYIFALPTRKRLDVSAALVASLGKIPEIFQNGHRYFEAITWTGPLTLEFKVTAYDNDPNGFEANFTCDLSGHVSRVK